MSLSAVVGLAAAGCRSAARAAFGRGSVRCMATVPGATRVARVAGPACLPRAATPAAAAGIWRFNQPLLVAAASASAVRPPTLCQAYSSAAGSGPGSGSGSSPSPARPPAPPITLRLSAVPTPVKLLGFAGLIPFLGTAAGALYMPEAVWLISQTQSVYGCSILSFMGAVHWGLAMASYGDASTNSKRYILSTVPSLLAFFAVAFIPHVPIQLIAEMLGFNALLLGDVVAHRKSLAPPWYISLRIWLTSIVTVCLGVNVYVAYTH
ncbi:hypothetical protein BC831DRAFT_476514 [Entophlyctis helioformis]|nr:hypothetical protein BC831DRAFT_476514 [Entophlyctis helioformis]